MVSPVKRTEHFGGKINNVTAASVVEIVQPLVVVVGSVISLVHLKHHKE